MKDNSFCDNNKLSWKAKGILAFIMSSTEKIEMKNILESSKESKDAVYSGVEELIKEGYIQKTEEREGGKFKSLFYTATKRATLGGR